MAKAKKSPGESLVEDGVITPEIMDRHLFN